MTVETVVASKTTQTPSLAASVLSPRVRLWLLVAASAFCGLAAGYNQAVVIEDAQLATLIEFMAVIKLGIVAGAALLVDWRLKSAISPNLALFYALAVAAMAAAPGLIWFASNIIAASALFHAGLIAALLLSLRDDRWLQRKQI